MLTDRAVQAGRPKLAHKAFADRPGAQRVSYRQLYQDFRWRANLRFFSRSQPPAWEHLSKTLRVGAGRTTSFPAQSVGLGNIHLVSSLPGSGVGAHWQTLCVEVNRITGCSTQSACSGVPPPERRHQQDRSSQNLGRFSKLSSVSVPRSTPLRKVGVLFGALLATPRSPPGIHYVQASERSNHRAGMQVNLCNRGE